MSDHEATVSDSTDQPGEALDDAKLPAEMPQKPQASLDYGTTEQEMAEGEPLDTKLARETADVGEGGSTEPETTSTPLMDDADESGHDDEKDLVGQLPVGEPHHEDSGRPDTPAPAEQAAVHVERE